MCCAAPVAVSAENRRERSPGAFAVAEFRALWLAQVFSVAGDQLAAVGIAVLVFDRTGSPAWTALSYAMTFLPDLAGGALLGGLADRYPRRHVMIACDLARAALVAVMAIPGQPVAFLVVILAVTQLLSAPFQAARNAVLPAVLAGERYLAGVMVSRITLQLGQVAGFAAGGVVVATLGTGSALRVDAGTFLLSAALVRACVRPHRPAGADGKSPTWWGGIRAGFALVAGDPQLRSLIGLACICGAYVVPEGLAAPYAAQIHAGTTAVGWLMAASPAGMVTGMLLLRRLPATARPRLMGPLAVASCAALLPTALGPPLAWTVVLWYASGTASAYNMITNVMFVQRVPDHARGQAVGLAQAAIRLAQGIGIVGSGLLAQVLTPAVVVAVAAVAGVLLACAAMSPRP